MKIKIQLFFKNKFLIFSTLPMKMIAKLKFVNWKFFFNEFFPYSVYSRGVINYSFITCVLQAHILMEKSKEKFLFLFKNYSFILFEIAFRCPEKTMATSYSNCAIYFRSFINARKFTFPGFSPSKVTRASFSKVITCVARPALVAP